MPSFTSEEISWACPFIRLVQKIEELHFQELKHLVQILQHLIVELRKEAWKKSREEEEYGSSLLVLYKYTF